MSDEKIAIVTGAAQGVGLVTASTLAQLGYRTVLTDIQDLDDPVENLTARGLSGRRRRGRHLVRGVRAGSCASASNAVMGAPTCSSTTPASA